MTDAAAREWLALCALADVPVGGGVAALLPGAEQVAIFRFSGDQLYAVSNIDPVTGAAVLSRGIVGDSAGTPVVTSPLLKQRYDLRSGTCLDAEGIALTPYPLRVTEGTVFLGTRRDP